MINRKSTMLVAVFFWAGGLICTGPVIGADETAPGNSEEAGKPASIFADETGGDAERAPEPERLPGGQEVQVGNFGEIDLHVKELDLSKVLQLLSIQSQRNIIATRNVSGSITADLYKVDFYEALDAILQPNGLRFVEKGNFIYVYTASEFLKIQEQNRKTVVRVLTLDYITATDASTFVRPLLSAAGEISLSGAVGNGFNPSVGDGGANSFAHAETMVIKDYPEVIDEIIAVIEKLDIRPKQVLVEATILEAKLTEDNKFGVDFTAVIDHAIDDFTSPASAIADLIAGTVGPEGGAIQGGNNLASDDNSVQIGLVGRDVAAFIDALDRVTDTTILANPKLLVLNRQRANLLVGERKGYVSTTQTDTASTQTIEFLETGTQLTVRPFVSSDNMIRMELKPSISTGNVRELADFVVPEEQTEEVTTNVLVPSGQTVVLGGLFKEETTVTRKQVPWLGDIPLFGVPFKGQSDKVTRNEFIFMITGTVMKDEAMARAVDRINKSAEMARIGSREGLLPWSRTKLTANHMRMAMKYKEMGDTQRAIWSLGRALHLDPTLRDAREMREELGVAHKHWTHDSILKDSMDAMIEAHAKAQGLDEVEEGTSDDTATDETAENEAPVEPDFETVNDDAEAWSEDATEGDVQQASDAEGDATTEKKADDQSVIDALDSFLPATDGDDSATEDAPVEGDTEAWSEDDAEGADAPADNSTEAPTDGDTEATDAEAADAEVEASATDAEATDAADADESNEVEGDAEGTEADADSTEDIFDESVEPQE